MDDSRAARLQELIHRRDKVLAILHPPSAAHARIMEKAGCEALFVGTGGVVGAYTGLADVGTATMTECLTIAGWIAASVSIPVIVDGDTGHGGIMAVRRLIRESIRAGLAGIRIDDQPIEGKRKTQNAGIDVVPLDQALVRYRAAVDIKNEIDPNFVVMAQCYARDVILGTLDDTIARMKAYREEARVDWVQFESPHSVDEIKAARAVIDGPFSFMRGKLGRYLDLDEHLALGVNIAWYPGFTTTSCGRRSSTSCSNSTGAASPPGRRSVLHTFTVMPPYAPGGQDTWENLWLQRARRRIPGAACATWLR